MKTELLLRIAAFIGALGVVTQFGRNIFKSMFRFVVQPITQPIYQSLFGQHIVTLQKSITEMGEQTIERLDQDRCFYATQMETLTENLTGQMDSLNTRMTAIDKEMHPNGGGSFRDDVVRLKALAESNHLRIGEVSDDVRDAGHRIDRILELQRCDHPHQ